jgi:hypothetical protein
MHQPGIIAQQQMRTLQQGGSLHDGQLAYPIQNGYSQALA